MNNPASSQFPVAAIGALVAASDLFGVLPSDAVARVADLMRVKILAPEEVLMRQGDAGDSLYLLLHGSLLVSSAASARSPFRKRVTPGAILGELALVTGYPRAATAAAEAESVVAQLHRDDFHRLRESLPEEMAKVILAIEKLLASYQIEAAAAVSPLLQSMSAELRKAFLARLTIEPLKSGETLMRAGESGGAVYLIVSGRLLVLGSPEPNPDTATIPESEVLAELGKGDTVGETSLMTGDPRTATVVALRDSLVAALDQQAFKQLIQAFPLEMMSILTRQLNRRSQESQAHRRHDRPPASIAILPLAPESNASAFTARLQQALSTFGEVLSVSRETPLVRNSTAASETRLVEWLNDQENSFRHVLYQAEPAATRWTLRSIRQADRIYLLANAADDPSASALRLKDILHSELRATGAHQPAKHYHLILLHPSGDTRAAGTELWRAAFPMVTEHHHVRLDHDADFARLARSINQRLVGLALGGGFALGIAHIGIIRAMRELNIPIDQVGGTSMGSVVAAACAMHFDYEQMLDVIVVGCANSLKRDYTFPVLSLLTGAKMARVLGVHLGNLRVEDFWLPYFSISASLRHASMVVHTQGNALRSVLASSRAPVMFPPLQWGDDLLVDGGLVNNIPADVMRSLTPGGTVFAVDVSRSEEIPRPTGENLSVSGWKQLLGRFAPRSKRQPTVNMLDVLGRIIRLGGVSRAQLIRADADCYLAPPLTGFKALDFAQGRQIAEASYEWALQALGSWLHQNGRPWESSEINPSTLQDSPPHQSAEA